MSVRRAWPAVLALALGVIACGRPSVDAPRAPQAVEAKPRLVEVVYREPASAFEILDNVARWMPEKNDDEYREEWEKRFGALSAPDIAKLGEYGAVRSRHYPPEPERDERDLFARAKEVDRFAEAFYGASSMDDAFARLATAIGSKDASVVKTTFDHFRDRLGKMLADDRDYTRIAATLDGRLDPKLTEAYVRRLLRFYDVKTAPGTFTVLFVHWPPVENVQANTRGRHLLMKYNAQAHATDAARDVEIPMHEIAHWVSSQGVPNRLALSERFLARCDPRASVKKTPKILEEPLAVAHQKVFLRIADPARFDRNGRWYSSDPWIAPFAKALFDYVQSEHELSGTLDETFIDQAAAACANLRR